MRALSKTQGMGVFGWLLLAMVSACAPVAPSIEKKNILSNGGESQHETPNQNPPTVVQNLTPPTPVQKTELRFVSEKTFQTIRSAIDSGSVLELPGQMNLDFSKSGSIQINLNQHVPKAVFVVLKLDLEAIRDAGGYTAEQIDKARLIFDPSVGNLQVWDLKISNEASEEMRKSILKQAKVVALVFTENLKTEDLRFEVETTQNPQGKGSNN